MVTLDKIFPSEPYYDVTVRDERQCISLCTNNELCMAFDVYESQQTKIECRLFDFTFEFNEKPLIEKKRAKIYSKKLVTKKNCQEWYKVGARKNGVYMVHLFGIQRQVYCYMEGEGGGWMAFQRRFDGSVDFHTKHWDDYKKGFGDEDGEYWLGNDILYKLTSEDKYDLFVIAENFDGETQIKRFEHFTVGSEASDYVFDYQSVYNGYSTHELFKSAKGNFPPNFMIMIVTTPPIVQNIIQVAGGIPIAIEIS